ncbi:MAG: Mur ligase domain-containing protein, partial [Aestuariivirgaceae bacterium]
MSLRTLMGPDITLSEEAGRLAISGLTADSRRVRPGDLFFALSGTNADGVRYIGEAVAKGATAVVAEPRVGDAGVALIHDDNPRRRLALAAARFYRRQPDLCVAVTGTNGKTSVAAFVRQIWQSMGFRAASLGTIGIAGPSGDEYLTHT